MSNVNTQIQQHTLKYVHQYQIKAGLDDQQIVRLDPLFKYLSHCHHDPYVGQIIPVQTTVYLDCVGEAFMFSDHVFVNDSTYQGYYHDLITSRNKTELPGLKIAHRLIKTWCKALNPWHQTTRLLFDVTNPLAPQIVTYQQFYQILQPVS